MGDAIRDVSADALSSRIKQMKLQRFAGAVAAYTMLGVGLLPFLMTVQAAPFS